MEDIEHFSVNTLVDFIFSKKKKQASGRAANETSMINARKKNEEGSSLQARYGVLEHATHHRLAMFVILQRKKVRDNAGMAIHHMEHEKLLKPSDEHDVLWRRVWAFFVDDLLVAFCPFADSLISLIGDGAIISRCCWSGSSCLCEEESVRPKFGCPLLGFNCSREKITSHGLEEVRT